MKMQRFATRSIALLGLVWALPAAANEQFVLDEPTWVVRPGNSTHIGVFLEATARYSGSTVDANDKNWDIETFVDPGNGVSTQQGNGHNGTSIWIDADHDGIAQRHELMLLEKAGVDKIGLHFRGDSTYVDEHGNAFRYLSHSWRIGQDGRSEVIRTMDVFFVRAP